MAKPNPCVLYETKLKTNLEKVSIRHNGDKKDFPVFDPDQGAECLMFVVDVYLQKGTAMGFAVAQFWNNFTEVLDLETQAEWTQISDAVNNRTMANFRQATTDLIHLFCPGDHPRDVMIDYLTHQCKKPFSKAPRQHRTRMEKLCKIANRLNGSEAELTPVRIRTIILESFPTDWQNKYMLSGHTPETQDLNHQIAYMDKCKAIADAERDQSKKRKHDDAERIRGGGDKSKSNNKDKKQNKNAKLDLSALRPHDPCPMENHHHKWGVCSMNPKGENFGRDMRNGGRGGGRGGYQGRGGNYNNNRGGYNAYNNNYSHHNRGSYHQGGRGGGGRGGGYQGRGGGNGYQGGRGANQQQQQQQDNYHYQQNNYEQPPGSNGGSSASQANPQQGAGDQYWAEMAGWRESRSPPQGSRPHQYDRY